MTKATYNQGLAYSFKVLVHDHHGREHGGRHGVEAVAGSLHLIHKKAERERERLSLAGFLKPQSSP